jgi:hypothetical protein
MTHPVALELWKEQLLILESNLNALGTDPAIIQSIIKGLSSWHDAPCEDTSSGSPAFHAQEAIGWWPFLLGFVSTQWANDQAKCVTIPGRFSSQSWMEKVIRWVWHIPWNMWVHRNQALHTADISPQRQQTARMIQDELQTGPLGLDPHTASLFRASATTISTAPLPMQQAWLQSVRLGRKHTPLTAQQTLLRNWLSSQPSTT